MRIKACLIRAELIWALLALIFAACARPTRIPATTPIHEPTSGGSEPTPVPTEVRATRPPAPSSPRERIVGGVRSPVVAGQFYPADPDELASLVDRLLAEAEPVAGAPVGLVVPHAGYVFSGAVAAAGFRQLTQATYDLAVVIGGDHQLPLSNPISVWAEGGFETPLGVVPVDAELAQALIGADPRIGFDRLSHQDEHPIEVEIPFLQRACPGCRILPILMASDDEETVRALADALLEVLPPTGVVVIASSDLSHYPGYDDAAALDGATLAAIETGDATRVRQTVARQMEKDVPGLLTCACGLGPILVAMRVAQGLGADTGTVLGYANSGDSPFGDRSGVVGYGAVMFWRYEPRDITGRRRAKLPAPAWSTLAEYLKTDSLPLYKTDDPAGAASSDST